MDILRVEPRVGRAEVAWRQAWLPERRRTRAASAGGVARAANSSRANQRTSWPCSPRGSPCTMHAAWKSSMTSRCSSRWKAKVTGSATVIRTPSSSTSSRANASSGVSPSSTAPPGNSHSPPRWASGRRRARRMRPSSRSTTAATTTRRLRSGLLRGIRWRLGRRRGLGRSGSRSRRPALRRGGRRRGLERGLDRRVERLDLRLGPALLDDALNRVVHFAVLEETDERGLDLGERRLTGAAPALHLEDVVPVLAAQHLADLTGLERPRRPLEVGQHAALLDPRRDLAPLGLARVVRDLARNLGEIFASGHTLAGILGARLQRGVFLRVGGRVDLDQDHPDLHLFRMGELLRVRVVVRLGVGVADCGPLGHFGLEVLLDDHPVGFLLDEILLRA